MRRQLMLGLWVVFSLAAPTFASRALAQGHDTGAASAEPAGYRETVDQALAEYAAKNYEEAGALFARAHALYPNARTLRGLGMASFELRRYEESIPYLESALGSQTRALDGQLRSDTEALLARAQSFVARVTVALSPASANLAVDGERVAYAASTPLLLGLGEHALSAEADGYRPERRNLRVRGGEVVRIDLQLHENTRGVAQHEQTEQPRRLIKSPWLWTAVGVVVAGAAVTAALLATGGDPEQRVTARSAGSNTQGPTLEGLVAR